MEKTNLVNKHKVRRGAKRNQPDKISQEFANNVRKKLGNHVKKIILFGSRARGDFYEGSDYDILIVLDRREKDLQEIVLDESDEIMNKYDALIGYIVCDENEWEKKKKFPIGLNILKEGIEL
jgi:predicted nucleotidyltransferase